MRRDVPEESCQGCPGGSVLRGQECPGDSVLGGPGGVPAQAGDDRGALRGRGRGHQDLGVLQHKWCRGPQHQRVPGQQHRGGDQR